MGIFLLEWFRGGLGFVAELPRVIHSEEKRMQGERRRGKRSLRLRCLHILIAFVALRLPLALP